MAQDDPKLNFTGLNSDLAARWQAGVPNADGHPPGRHVTAAGTGPRRDCLGEIAGGAPYLILAHRPFPKPQPYAEVGPIFLCAAPCARYDGPAVPPLFLTWRAIMIRGYGADNRIVYGSGQVIPPRSIRATSKYQLGQPAIAYLHLRSDYKILCVPDRPGLGLRLTGGLKAIAPENMLVLPVCSREVRTGHGNSMRLRQLLG